MAPSCLANPLRAEEAKGMILEKLRQHGIDKAAILRLVG